MGTTDSIGRGVADLEQVDLRPLAELRSRARGPSFYARGGGDPVARRSRSTRPHAARRQRRRARALRAVAHHAPRAAADQRRARAQGSWSSPAGRSTSSRATPLPVAPRDVLWIDSSPYLRPLAELQDEYIPFVVVAADNRSARIWQVVSAQAPGRAEGARRRQEPCQEGRLVAEALSAPPGERASPLRQGDRRGARAALRRAALRAAGAARHAWRSWPRSRTRCRSGSPAPWPESSNVDLKADGDEQIDAAFDLSFEQERQDEAVCWERIAPRSARRRSGGGSAREVLPPRWPQRRHRSSCATQDRRDALPRLRAARGRQGAAVPALQVELGVRGRSGERAGRSCSPPPARAPSSSPRCLEPLEDLVEAQGRDDELRGCLDCRSEEIRVLASAYRRTSARVASIAGAKKSAFRPFDRYSSHPDESTTFTAGPGRGRPWCRSPSRNRATLAPGEPGSARRELS